MLIDFGLASAAQYAEHYAVDLYVLERAFASTHPASEGLYAGVSLESDRGDPEPYHEMVEEKRWLNVLGARGVRSRHGQKVDGH